MVFIITQLVGYMMGKQELKTDGNGDGRAYHVLNAHAFKSLNVGLNYVITGNHGYQDGDGVPGASTTNLPETPMGRINNGTATQGAHTHTMQNGEIDITKTTANGPHNNLPPYLTMKYMIYAGTFYEHGTASGGGGGN